MKDRLTFKSCFVAVAVAMAAQTSVQAQPTFTTQPSPANQPLQIGGGITWTVAATPSAGSLTYQWYQGGASNAIAGATKASYTLASVTTNVSGVGFFCIATDSNGSTSSSNASVTVLTPTSAYVSVVMADDPVAFFRLDEGPDNAKGNNEVTAYDTAGSHNGVYNDVILQRPGYSTVDPDDVAAVFGQYPAVGSTGCYVGLITGVNFSSPVTIPTNFSVEAWVNLTANSVAGAGIVAKAPGNSTSQEFALDTGGTANAFRFYFYNAAGTTAFTVSPNVAPSLGTWYHLVGVLNESANVMCLYTNGALAATTTLTADSGVRSTTFPLTIGSRPATTGGYTMQVDGTIANVALYNYALSSSQVLKHYVAASGSLAFAEVPTNTTVIVGQTATFYSSAVGAAPLSYQWQLNGASLTNGPSPNGAGAIISGATSSNLTISGVTLADCGETYTIVVTNGAGATPPASATLTVESSQSGPQIIQLTPLQLWKRLEFQIVNVPSAANPFDPASISVDLAFTLPSGSIVTVPAFWYQGYQRQLLSSGYESLTPSGSAQWRARFAPPEAGIYSVTLTIRTNGQPSGSPVISGFTIPAGAPPPGSGYVGVAAGKEYLETSDGRALRLVGHNVCWFDAGGTYDYDTWFAAMAAAGENYARIWMCPWAFGIEDTPTSLTDYALQPAWQLDYVLELAEQLGIRLELCLDYHGMFATQPDASGGNNVWPQNPYNVTNGGPCAVANDFFTSSTAQTIYQKRLRYLVGRYGYSPNLAAWQLLNEIDNDYSFLNATDVAAWHSVMGAWLHANDPFSHLVTTSLTGGSIRPEIWTIPTMDIATYHSYGETGPATRLSVVSQSMLQSYGKPVLIDEFGTSSSAWNTTGDPYLRGFRQGIWGGALGGSVGTAMSWYWENIQSGDVYPAYTALGAILAWTDWGQGVWTNVSFRTSKSSPAAIGLRGARESLLYVVAPGVAWPAGATNASLPLQAGQSVTLANWPAGSYYAAWYAPATGAYVGRTQAATTNNSLNLPLPAFSEDLAGLLAISNAPIWGPTIITQPQSQTVNPGVNVTFSVTATGIAPLAYQWRFNAGNIAGATASSYTANNVQTTSAGSYSVVVTNAYGSTNSANAVLTVLMPPNILIAPSYSAGGVFQFNLAGAAGSNYVIEASTNLTDWIPLETNTSPFTFTDTNAVHRRWGFYRALGWP